jgi:hypothetical protein
MHHFLHKILILTGILVVTPLTYVHAQQDEYRERYRNYNPESLARALIGFEPINETSMKPDDRHIRIWLELFNRPLRAMFTRIPFVRSE